MSKVDEVERLMQVVALLQAAGDLPVPSARLKEHVVAYQAPTSPEALRKLMENDVKRLGEIGILVDQVAEPGAESLFVLRPGQARVPVDLSASEQGLLVWLAAAGDVASVSGGEGGDGGGLDQLVGHLPKHLELAQAALAQRRRLKALKRGQDNEFEPARLASRAGRWYLIGRWADWEQVIAPRLDRMEISGLGGPIQHEIDVPDLDVLLDATAWPGGPRQDVELQCRTDDLGLVASWFPRAEVESRPDGSSVLRFWITKEDALVSRVIGLGGAVTVVSPLSAVAEIRRRAQSVLRSA